MPSRQRKATRPDREWVGGTIPTPFVIEDRDPPYRSSAVFWFERPDDGIVGTTLVPPDEATGAVGEVLREALRKPAFGPPRRPDRIRVASAELADEVRAVVGTEIPVEVAPTPEVAELLDSLVATVDDMNASESAVESYLAGGVTPAAVGELFRAAEALYRIAPWQVATDDQIIRVDIPALGIDGACLVVIGNLGESLGLLLFASVADYEAFAGAADSPTGSGPRLSLRESWLGLNFERGAELPDTMRREVADHGWPVAAPDAYPVVDRIESDLLRIPAGERDLKIATRVAWAVATFFTKHVKLFALESDEPVCESFYDGDDLEVRLCAPYEAYPLFDIPDPGRAATVVRNRPKLGRNDPCHCGSGRKYKRCHLREDEAQAAAPTAPAGNEHDVEDRLIDRMLDYTANRFGPAWFELVSTFEDPDEAMVLAVPWSIHDAEIDGATGADWFLEDHGHSLSPAERAIIASEQAAWLSVWEVTAVDPGVGLTLEDLLSGEVRTVIERTASRSLVVRDAVLTRIVDQSDGSYLAGLYPRILPPAAAAEVVRLARGRLRRKRAVPVERLRDTRFGRYLIRKWEKAVIAEDRLREAPPRLSNSDGDPYLLTTDRFRLEPGAAADVAGKISALDDVHPPVDGEEGHVFMRPTHDAPTPATHVIVGHAFFDRDSLRLETNSIARADELRARVEAVCGDLIEHQIREHADPQSSAAVRPDPGDRPEPTAEMQDFEREYQRRHYETWPDRALPALGGRTPREAVRTADGRREVDTVLKAMENAEARLRGADGFDFSALRRELGVD